MDISKGRLSKKPIQLYLESHQYQVLKMLARQSGLSLASLVRRSIDRYLSELPVDEDPALQIIGLGRSGRGDLSVQHDSYLAEFDKKARDEE